MQAQHVRLRRASNILALSDVFDAIRLGIRDFFSAPLLGLFFGAVYVLAGFLLYYLMAYYRTVWLILPLAVGFPLIGPFVAAGLYEISRRLQTGSPLNTREIFTVLLGQSRREFGWMAFVILFIYWIWMYQIRLLVAFFMGFAAFVSIDGFMQALMSHSGSTFLMVGTAIGALLSFVLFSCTVIAMPMLLERDVDFITAIITSWRTVFENPVPMLGFGIIVAALTFLALAPFFLGLLVVLPVLGHATWHLYKKAIPPA